MDLQLAGLRALVTGGTKGIGRAIVEGLLAEGADVAFCARTESDVKSTVEALSGDGPRVLGEALNVADGPALTDWVGRVAEEFGGLDIVVCNVSAALPHLERSESGNIVVVSSVSAREIDFAAAAYGATKAALVHYTQGLAYEFAPKGIRANCVSPGNTSFPGGVWDQLSQSDPAFHETALALNPTGRMGKPAEMAYAVTMLASPRASFISGTNVVVDGALTRGVQL
jgi:3-oxoacyl-[acyl-carrier protein] reductase